jgi:hypothetical protein
MMVEMEVWQSRGIREVDVFGHHLSLLFLRKKIKVSKRNVHIGKVARAPYLVVVSVLFTHHYKILSTRICSYMECSIWNVKSTWLVENFGVRNQNVGQETLCWWWHSWRIRWVFNFHRFSVLLDFLTMQICKCILLIIYICLVFWEV